MVYGNKYMIEHDHYVEQIFKINGNIEQINTYNYIYLCTTYVNIIIRLGRKQAR